MRRLAASALVLLAAFVLTASARADYVIDGRGFGHGVGMSQYGAYGYALREGRDFRWILGHYYPGTNVGRVATARMRVLLRDTRVPKVCGATAVRDAAGRRHAHATEPRPPARARAGDRRRVGLRPRHRHQRRPRRELPRRAAPAPR